MYFSGFRRKTLVIVDEESSTARIECYNVHLLATLRRSSCREGVVCLADFPCFGVYLVPKEMVSVFFLGGKLGKGVVLLSEDQIDDLLNKLSLEEFNKYVCIIADNELRGHHYKKKTHYVAILEMVAKDRRTINADTQDP